MPFLRLRYRLGYVFDSSTGFRLPDGVETVFIYRAGGGHDELHDFGRCVSGEEILPGFDLELAALR